MSTNSQYSARFSDFLNQAKDITALRPPQTHNRLCYGQQQQENIGYYFLLLLAIGSGAPSFALQSLVWSSDLELTNSFSGLISSICLISVYVFDLTHCSGLRLEKRFCLVANMNRMTLFERFDSGNKFIYMYIIYIHICIVYIHILHSY